jgi:CubicO group peptidase (beta-lactamase class C family)
MVSDSLADADVAAVESFVADWLTEAGVPGAAVAVVEGDDVAYAEGFGARDLETEQPATPDTLFGVASCTKPFTAIAVMQLVERGDLALDDPVADSLPHLEDAPGDPITVAELLSHTSGLPSDDQAGAAFCAALGLDVDPVPLTTDADLRRHVQGSLDRRVTDRETFFYYNTGYALLALLVAEHAGQPFGEYVEENMLEPAGMYRATFDEGAFEAVDDRMTPYLDAGEGLEPASFPFRRHTRGAGGLLASVRDLANAVRLFLGDGVVDGEHVLDPESVDAMTTPVAEFGTYLDGTAVEYGYGTMLEPYLDDRLVGHAGDIVVSTAWFGYLEAAERGVAIACNASTAPHPADVGMGVLALLDGRDPDAVQPHYRFQAALDDVTGEYSGYRDVTTATVEAVGGSLRIDIDAGAGEQELLAVPEAFDADAVRCRTVGAGGFDREVRFDCRGDTVDLFHERARLQQTE